MWKVLVAVFRFLFLKVRKSAPAIEKEIAQVLATANANVAQLQKDHVVATLHQQMDADIAAARKVAEDHVALIKAKFEAELAKHSEVLPSVASQLGVATGATGPSGPTGAVGA